jgi:hypothetical protein
MLDGALVSMATKLSLNSKVFFKALKDLSKVFKILFSGFLQRWSGRIKVLFNSVRQ